MRDANLQYATACGQRGREGGVKRQTSKPGNLPDEKSRMLFEEIRSAGVHVWRLSIFGG